MPGCGFGGEQRQHLSLDETLAVWGAQQSTDVTLQTLNEDREPERDPILFREGAVVREGYPEEVTFELKPKGRVESPGEKRWVMSSLSRGKSSAEALSWAEEF